MVSDENGTQKFPLSYPTGNLKPKNMKCCGKDMEEDILEPIGAAEKEKVTQFD